MAGGKIIPIISAGDQALRDDAQAIRDDVYAALVASAAAIDAQIKAIDAKVDRTIKELMAMRDQEEG